jgi:tRNA G37 N-methylase Trm5
VLDPFSGVGTTLVEAVLGGHNAIGFEINPYAALASRVKATAHNIAVSDFQQYIRDFRTFYQESITGEYTPRSEPPAGFKTRSAFYSPAVLRKVLILPAILIMSSAVAHW